MMQTALIPQDEYLKIVEQMPILCVDIIPIRSGKFLLAKRTNEPAKNEWFPIGGRVYKGETLEDAARRKTREELGVAIEGESVKQLGVGETLFTGSTIDQNRHSVNVIYAVGLESEQPLALDGSQLAEAAWFERIDAAWHPYVQDSLRKAGFE